MSFRSESNAMDNHDMSPLNKSYASNITQSPSMASNTSNASSSKAVLAALRALQDKIRRLESERSQALDETSSLRNQLKNSEIETSHFREKEKFSTEKILQEARGAYEKIKHEKEDLENKLMSVEAKNKDCHSTTEDLQCKIQNLEEEKSMSELYQKDAGNEKAQLENQLQHLMQRENELSQTMLWESKRHEEEIASLNAKVLNLKQDLSTVTQEKSTGSTTMTELDQLVGQLLTVNEQLVAKLSGKPVTISATTSGTGKKTKKNTKSTVNNIPRAAYVTTAATEAGRATKVYGRAGLVAQAKAAEVEHLTQLHNMFAKMAKGITKKRTTKTEKVEKNVNISTSSKKTRIGKRRTTANTNNNTNTQSVDDSRITVTKVTTPSPAKSTRRHSASPLIGHTNNTNHSNHSNHTNSRSVYIPAPSILHSSPGYNKNNDSNGSILNSNGSRKGSGSASGTPSNNQSDLNDVINSLEAEFDSLNNQYSHLLSSVKQTNTNTNTNSNTGYDSVRSSAEVGGSEKAEELVSVIHQLHRKGEQLRQLKNSPTKQINTTNI